MEYLCSKVLGKDDILVTALEDQTEAQLSSTQRPDLTFIPSPVPMLFNCSRPDLRPSEPGS